MITVVGYDGSALTPAADAALAAAALVVGGRRHLAAVPVPPGARTVELGDVDDGVEALLRHEREGAGPAVVVASGDPGFFGIVRALRVRGAVPVVLPAVSAVAAAFARAGLPWDDALVVSAHGRALRAAANACRALPKVAVLTAAGSGPAQLGAALADVERTFVVAEDLGGADEAVTRCSPDEAARRVWRDPNVVLVLDEGRAVGGRGWRAGPPAPRGWALPEDAFAHRDGMITKAEVRALVLPRLDPQVGDLVWDVGAGSGSVGVECARLGAAVVAVERDPAACDLVAGNAAMHGVDVRVVTGCAPDVLADLPDPDAVFVGGSGPATVAACAARHPARLVVALSTLERVAGTALALAAVGYAVEGELVQVSRLAPLSGGVHRLAPINPVILLAGRRG
ncbi:MAG: precorrin-6y C5,15-methyltransferase (decarboxylating) subunit CbiE [Mycobacterium leprae]